MDRPEPDGRFDGSVWDDLRALDQLDEQSRTAKDEARIRYQYESDVRYSDLWLGRLFEGLKQLDLYDRYVIAVTSDHGEELWDHGQRPHGTSLHDELVRVPLIIRFPSSWGVRPRRVNIPAGHVDIAPTLLAAAGIGIPDEFVGMDLWDEAEGYYQPLEDTLAYSEMLRRGLDMEAVSNGAEKLIHDRAGTELRQRGRRHVVSEEDTIRSISRRYFRDQEHMDEIMAANPVLSEQVVRPVRLDLPVGEEIVIPDLEMNELSAPYKFYDLVNDPGEQQDRYDPNSASQRRLVRKLQVMSSEIMRRRQPGRIIEKDELDDETLRQLQGLGYIQNGD